MTFEELRVYRFNIWVWWEHTLQPPTPIPWERQKKGVVLADPGRTVAGVEWGTGAMNPLTALSAHPLFSPGPPMGQCNRKPGNKKVAVPTGQHPCARAQQRRGWLGVRGKWKTRSQPLPKGAFCWWCLGYNNADSTQSLLVFHVSLWPKNEWGHNASLRWNCGLTSVCKVVEP